MEPAQDRSINPPLPPFPALTAQPPRRSSVSWNLLGFAIGVALALKLFGPEWVWLFAPGAHTLGELALLFAALNAAIVMHEAGHLAMAWVLGFELLGGSLGPVRAIRMHGRWSFQFSRNPFSGSAIVVPRRIETNWRARMLAVVAAGPLATFLTTIVSALLLITFATSESWFARFLGASFELNFFLFILGLFPNTRGARLQNDARLFCSFLKNTPEANEILLYHLVGQLQVAGIRPRDFPEHIIRKVAQAHGRPELCVAHANAIVLWAVDRGDVTTADAWERRAMDLSDFCEWRLQNTTLAASASFDLIFRNDAASAKNKLAQVQVETLSPRWYRHRIAAVYWLAAGKVPQALAEIARAQYEFPNRLPYYDFEKMLLTRLHRKAIAMQPDDLATRCSAGLT